MIKSNVSWCRAMLATNAWLRRNRENEAIDQYVRLVMAFRVYVAEAEARPVTLSHLSQEVSPELVSESTALRHISEMRRLGHVALARLGRGQVVTLTGRGKTVLETFIKKRREDLMKEGFVWRDREDTKRDDLSRKSN